LARLRRAYIHGFKATSSTDLDLQNAHPDCFKGVFIARSLFRSRSNRSKEANDALEEVDRNLLASVFPPDSTHSVLDPIFQKPWDLMERQRNSVRPFPGSKLRGIAALTGSASDSEVKAALDV